MKRMMLHNSFLSFYNVKNSSKLPSEVSQYVIINIYFLKQTVSIKGMCASLFYCDVSSK